MKTVAIEWDPFFRGQIVPKKTKKVLMLQSTSTGALAMVPASQNKTWTEILNTVLGISDWLCVGVIIFAGATWMFGNRTKAMEMMIGGSAGYLIIRHSKEIQEWLATI